MRPITEMPDDGKACLVGFKDMRGGQGFTVAVKYLGRIVPTLRMHGVVWDMEEVEWTGWAPLPDGIA